MDRPAITLRSPSEALIFASRPQKRPRRARRPPHLQQSARLPEQRPRLSKDHLRVGFSAATRPGTSSGRPRPTRSTFRNPGRPVSTSGTHLPEPWPGGVYLATRASRNPGHPVCTWQPARSGTLATRCVPGNPYVPEPWPAGVHLATRTFRNPGHPVFRWQPAPSGTLGSRCVPRERTFRNPW